jgi:hypothetical protein
LANGRLLPSESDLNESVSPDDLTINEMLSAYLQHADAHCVKNGKPTTEPVNIRLALRPLRKPFGHTSAAQFGPLRLEAVRNEMVDSGRRPGIRITGGDACRLSGASPARDNGDGGRQPRPLSSNAAGNEL